MSLRNEPLDWQLQTNNPYIPIYYQGDLVGFFKPEYASEINIRNGKRAIF